MAMIVVDTQYMENYGTAEAPYWKAKGGSEYKVTGIPANVDVDRVLFMLGQEVQWSDNGSSSTVIGTHIEADDYLSWFERSQMEYDGEIQFAEPSIDYTDLCILEAARVQEYADAAADLDAAYYGA